MENAQAAKTHRAATHYVPIRSPLIRRHLRVPSGYPAGKQKQRQLGRGVEPSRRRRLEPRFILGVGRALWTRLVWRVRKDPPYATEK